MAPRDFLFFAAVCLMPTASSGGAAFLIGRRFGGSPTLARLVVAGLVLGLLLTPVAMVTVGTLDGGYWDAFGLPGGPLVGIVLALSAACGLTTALLFSFGLVIRNVVRGP